MKRKIVLLKKGGCMRTFFLFLSTVVTIALGQIIDLTAQELCAHGKETTSSHHKFGCTVDGLKACQAAACVTEEFIGCALSSEARSNAICFCLTGAMDHCSNYTEILESKHARKQLHDFKHHNGGNCDGKKKLHGG